MADQRFESVRRQFTAEERDRFEEGKSWAEAHKDELIESSQARKHQIIALADAVRALHAERERRGISIVDVATRSGIDVSRLNELEIDPFANPTLEVVMRIAEALGVGIKIAIAA